MSIAGKIIAEDSSLSDLLDEVSHCKTARQMAQRACRIRKRMSFIRKNCAVLEAHSALDYLATVIWIITGADDVVGKIIKGAGKLNFKSLSG
ncbi:hypothetical protein [Enterobacter quasiroggenkampii]|uniref:hypothetical protein n=2 Tax=Enterobacteriaceae TaxID=543 RepID=UPI0021D121F0|nr:hypothetical protein [Enterobacter quasiroggenkampii]MCU6409542.1 hypothetical protein [Enterobacter quasiroggenkampii]